MKTPAAIAVGVATLWGPLFFVFFFATMIAFFVAPQPDGGILLPFKVLAGLFVFTFVLTGVLLVIYIVDVFRNEAVEGDRKAVWATILFLGNWFVMPVYWWLYLRPRPSTRTVEAAH